MLLIGTQEGLVTADGRPQLPDVAVVHAARVGSSWWALDASGTVWQDGTPAARAPAGVRLNCLQPTPDGVWLGADRARLFLLHPDELVEDEFFADAPGRDRWHTPWGAPPDVRSLAYGPDGVLYVNVHVGGILRYDDTGLAATVDIESDVHQVVAHPQRGGTVVAASAWGVAYSHNGHEFEFRTDGLDHSYCRAVAVVGDTVVVSASSGPAGGHARLYRGDLADGPLQPSADGLPGAFSSNLDTHCLVALDEAIYAGHDTTVWRSGDLGRTWELFYESASEITCLA